MADEETQEDQKADAQKQYLMAKVSELIDAVGPGYGEALMEELVNRLERTVAHFHEEITELLEALKKKAQERDEKLRSLMGSEEVEPVHEEEEEEKPETAAEREMSEWEKRVEAKTVQAGLTSSAGSQESGAGGEKPKKKGRFGRKKKK
ncbi:MAG: hypothetical protein ACE5HZ_08125 [Fidelibacterota bacterium]